MPVEIKLVQAGSPAHSAGICPGMQLNSINQNPICDGLDYEFYSAANFLCLELEGKDGPFQINLKKKEYQPLGLEFESYLIDGHHHCKNACIFCFIDQLPKGLRPSLYFKDDDERLGFLFGNYITLTNLTNKEVQRIIKMRFSPVNISVHTTNPTLRTQMMKNKNAGAALGFISQLAKAGIEMNFQLVLCPGINDGEELQKSIQDLAAFRPFARSVAAVPVGLTKHRHGLAKIQPYTAKTAAKQLQLMLANGNAFEKENGERFIYPSDEWFLLSGKDIPAESFYGDFPQLENGVGMWRLFEDEFLEALAAAKKSDVVARADLVTGVLAAPLLKSLAKKLQNKFKNVRLFVHPVINNFFGPGITVAGLLTGQDIIAQLKGKTSTSQLFLPQDILRAQDDKMLDDTAPAQIEHALGIKTTALPRNGKALLHAILPSLKHDDTN